jgi:hypothetical protein
MQSQDFQNTYFYEIIYIRNGKRFCKIIEHINQKSAEIKVKTTFLADKILLTQQVFF